MDTKSAKPKETSSGPVEDYREGVRKIFYQAIKESLDDEMHKAAQEIVEEQRKAIRQIVEEQKAVVRQVVEEEKKAIWEKADALRQSILTMGL